ncbi:MAG: rhomboid family intramembrane serine protease [Planctomycetaceae bacterium]
MRLIGKVDSLEKARLFAEYLLSLKISSSLEQDAQEWDIWIIEEDHLDQAITELEAFKQNPDDPKYKTGAATGRKFHKEAAKVERKRAGRQVNMRSQWHVPDISQCPATLLLIIVSIVVGVFSSTMLFDIGAKKEVGPIPNLLFLNIEKATEDMLQTREEALLHSVKIHEYWRYFTPIFIHYSFLHLLFNMMWMKDLGPVIESKTGSFLFLLIVAVIALVSNVAQLAIGQNPFFGGMSGVVFGLFGFIWLRGKLDTTSGMYMPPRLLAFLVIFQVLCFMGILGNIANWAHLFGFISGAAIGGSISLFVRWRRHS